MSIHYRSEDALVWHGDCIDLMRELDDGCIDAVVTDPPYNLTAGKKGGSGVASINLDSPYGRSRIGTGNGGGGFMGKKWDDYDGFLREEGTPGGFQHWCEVWAKECLRVLKPGGHLLAFGGSGTTAEAALLEGFRCMVMEREAGYLPLIVHRIERAKR